MTCWRRFIPPRFPPGLWYEWPKTKEEMQEFQREYYGAIRERPLGWMYEITDIKPPEEEIFRPQKQEQ
jgi:hypothetical protein